MSDLSVTWMDGYIWANLMPIVPPDPINCRAWLILENKNHREAFSEIRVPLADVILAETDSVLGTILFETTWQGSLAPGEIDTVRFTKITGNQWIFNPPCGQQVLLDFLIRNADGAVTVFTPDTLIFDCAF
jgi:hypothetical protein